MNARTKTQSLEELRTARAKLLKQEAALWAQRQKLAELERAAERAESDLKNVRGATSSEIENWAANGCIAPMPGIDSMGLARLQEKAIRARDAVSLAEGARRGID